MNFIENNKPIYLQIADKICDDILLGKYVDNDRIPSVREIAAQVEVNANTAMRAYDSLQSLGVIYNKRGIGYFVADSAKETIRRDQLARFVDTDLQSLFQRMALLGISSEDLIKLYREYINQNTKK